jgi:FixJ family two-component response regulator
MPKKRSTIAVIDDHLGILSALGRLLSTLGYNTELYISTKEFLDAAMTSEAICLIIDIQLGGSSGFELAQHLSQAGFTVPIIFMTADIAESVEKRAREIGCIEFLKKPFSPHTLVDALAKLSPRPSSNA